MAKILLVEDDVFITEIYAKKFESSGFEMAVARTGREALRQMQLGGFAIVLLDMVLPELSGMEILQEVRSKKDYDSNLKIVVFSNLSSLEERQEALKAGANGFISKTEFTPSQVVEEVKRYLAQFDSQEKNKERQVSESKMVPENANSPEGVGKCVLLIEDEPVFVEMFGKALRDAGYEVTTENDGEKGLALAKTGKFQLVITDHLLPTMNGKQIISTLRENEATKSLPIFLMTASLEQEEVKSMEASGAVERAFLKTEITPSELAKAVKDFFQD